MPKQIENWYSMYQEIKNQLKLFAVQYPKDIAYRLFAKLNTTDYKYANRWFAQGIEKYNNNRLDPIQVFASFNHAETLF